MTINHQSLNAEMLWSDFNLTTLYGNDYLNPFIETKSSAMVFTLEHAGSYHFGKSFLFIDRLSSNNTHKLSDDTYLEFGVDFGIGSIMGVKWGNFPIKDIYITTQWENSNPENTKNTDNILLGIGVRWQGDSAFLDTNIYYRINDQDKDNAQLTFVWFLPFSIFGTCWQFTGYFDLTNSTENSKEKRDIAWMFHTQPQIKWDIGKHFNNPDQWFIGMEYQYWKNKFGQDGQTQSVPQFLVQYHF
jgi:hypothetical protein